MRVEGMEFIQQESVQVQHPSSSGDDDEEGKAKKRHKKHKKHKKHKRHKRHREDGTEERAGLADATANT